MMPRPVPTLTIPLISPLFFLNHLIAVDNRETLAGLLQRFTSKLQDKQTCHSADTPDIKKQPTAEMTPITVIIILEPNLSLILPSRMENKPPRTNPKECAPEMAALLQPNYVSRELMKTPQLLVVPCSMKSIRTEAMITVQPQKTSAVGIPFLAPGLTCLITGLVNQGKWQKSRQASGI